MSSKNPPKPKPKRKKNKPNQPAKLTEQPRWGELKPAPGSNFHPYPLTESVTFITHFKNGHFLFDPEKQIKVMIERDSSSNQVLIHNYGCDVIYRNGTKLGHYDREEIRGGDELFIFIEGDQVVNAIFLQEDKPKEESLLRPTLEKRVSLTHCKSQVLRNQEEEFSCHICLMVMKDPIQMKPCGHSCCSSCIELLKQQNLAETCSYCQQKVKEFKEAYQLKEKIEWYLKKKEERRLMQEESKREDARREEAKKPEEERRIFKPKRIEDLKFKMQSKMRQPGFGREKAQVGHKDENSKDDRKALKIPIQIRKVEPKKPDEVIKSKFQKQNFPIRLKHQVGRQREENLNEKPRFPRFHKFQAFMKRQLPQPRYSKSVFESVKEAKDGMKKEAPMLAIFNWKMKEDERVGGFNKFGFKIRSSSANLK